MTKSRGINSARWSWTPEQVELLCTRYANTKAAELAAFVGCSLGVLYRKAYELGLAKSQDFLASTNSGRLLKGGTRGVGSRFAPGSEPWNKGTHYVAGGRSSETRFKKGGRPSSWLPIGTYRISTDGALERKVNDLPGANHVRWHPVSRLVWEKAHGPVPKGHMVVFRPGRATIVLELITLDALECISRAENARRNHPRNSSPELAQLYQLKGAITRQVNRIQRESQEQKL